MIIFSLKLYTLFSIIKLSRLLLFLMLCVGAADRHLIMHESEGGKINISIAVI